MKPRRAPEGYTYLNVGCGATFFPEWNNCDILPIPFVTCHDLRRDLPFSNNSLDVSYSSHALEHFTLEAGKRFLMEQWRVLKPSGICRVVVPDLEEICRNYLQCLESSAETRSEKDWECYR